MNDVTVAIITGIGLVLVALVEVIATVLTSKASAAKTTAALDKQQEVYKAEINGKFEKQQAVIDIRFNNIEKELAKTNACSEAIPVIQEQIKVINHRIEDLEKGR